MAMCYIRFCFGGNAPTSHKDIENKEDDCPESYIDRLSLSCHKLETHKVRLGCLSWMPKTLPNFSCSAGTEPLLNCGNIMDDEEDINLRIIDGNQSLTNFRVSYINKNVTSS